MFACEKLGFSRAYDTGQLKEKLRPVVGELLGIDFIEPVRYRKERPKVWKIAVAKRTANVEALPSAADVSSLESQPLAGES